MNNRPDAIRHMVTWGAMSGGVLAIIYSLIILGFSIPGYLSNIFFVALISMIAFTQGGILGIILGAVDSMLLKLLLGNVSPKFAKEEIKSKRKYVYAVIFAVPILVQLLYVLPAYVQNGFDLSAVPLPDTYLRDIAIPLLIGSIASTFAAHRYLLKLRQWSESLDARKAKIEQDMIHHLAEEAQHEEIFISEIEILEKRYRQ